jgi:hypothetical protein
MFLKHFEVLAHLMNTFSIDKEKNENKIKPKMTGVLHE